MHNDTPVSAPPNTYLDYLNKAWSLGIDSIVQVGDSNASYVVRFKDGHTVDLRDFKQLTNRKTWERIIFEQSGDVCDVTTREWREILHRILKVVTK